MDKDYHKLEFDVSPEPGREERDSFFDWAKNEPGAIRFVKGTQQIRMRSSSGHQILMFCPDNEHEGGPGWHSDAINKDLLLRAHLVNPGNSWTLASGPDAERVVTIDVLQVAFYEDVGWLLEVPETDDTVSVWPLTAELREEVHGAIGGIETYVPW